MREDECREEVPDSREVAWNAAMTVCVDSGQ